MGAKSTRKGKVGECEVIAALLPIWPGAVSTRSAQAANGRHRRQRSPDVFGVPFRIEVRRQARPNIREALCDAEQHHGAGPAVAWTRADRDEWIVTMRADDWLRLVDLATVGPRLMGQGVAGIAHTLANHEVEPLPEHRWPTHEETAR